jgi:putative ABC transport system permease protein
MICSVIIYFTFVSMQYSSDIQANMLGSMVISSIFRQASIILIIFVALFIWYSNSFFTKKRKKEVGLYSLLGMRKSTIGKMLFYENLIMGVLALATGIVLGTLLSKLFLMILLKLLGSAVNVSFSLSVGAMLNTVIVFAVILLFTSIQGYRLIYRFQLIELFRAEKEGEQLPQASWLAAWAGVICIGLSYWISTLPFTTTEEILRNLGILLGGIIVGTFLLFRSGTIYLLKISRRNKLRYYRGMNMIGTSQLMYRMKGNARLLAMISLLSAFTLSAICIAYSMYYSIGKTAAKHSPFSYMHISQGEAFDRQVEAVIARDQEHPVTVQLDIPVIKSSGQFSDPSMLPPRYLEADSKPIKLISASTFNRIQQSLTRDFTVQLSGNQAMPIKPLYTKFTFADFAHKTLTLQMPQKNSLLEFNGMIEERVLNWKFPDFYFVISDALFADLAQITQPTLYKAYKVKDEKTSGDVSAKLLELSPDSESDQMYVFYREYRKGMEESGLNMFIFGFLGLVLLAATGSMIYFKQLTEAQSDKGRYEILHQIGLSRKQIRASIAKQSLFVFALPLIVGIVHSAFIIKAFSSVMGSLIGINLFVPITISIVVYAGIYFIYYVLTVHTFNKIANS